MVAIALRVQLPCRKHRLLTLTISGLVNAVVKRSLVELGQRRLERRELR